MKKKKKRGFTLVELLAVIVVLAVILVIAVPKILDVIKSSRENSLISSVKLIARNAEQKKLANEVLGETEDFGCSEVADLSENDYQSCIINFDEEGNATVSITGKGKFSGYTCSGTKNDVTCRNGELVCNHYLHEYVVKSNNNETCMNDEQMKIVDVAAGLAYKNYSIKENLTIKQKNACVEFFKNVNIEYGEDSEWAETNANIMCNSDDSDEFSRVLVNDGLNFYISNGMCSFDDVKEYFVEVFERYSTYMIKPNLTNTQKNSCVDELTVLYNEEWGEDEWNSEYANLICKHQLPSTWGYVTFDDLLYDWGYSTYEELVNGEILYSISEDIYAFEDIEDYFDEKEKSICNGDYDSMNSDELLSNMIDRLINLGVVNEESIKKYMTQNVLGCSENYLTNLWSSYLNLHSIISITFHKSTSGFDGSGIDVSELHDGSILLYKTENGYDEEENITLYDIDIVSNETIYLPKNSNGLFSYLTHVESIDFNNSVDTSEVTNMHEMFEVCFSLKELDISYFNTSKVTDMGNMFNECESLEELDLSHFDTSKVTDMSLMFGWCHSLISLDLSSFDTGKVTDMSSMFAECLSLEELDLRGWNTSNVTDMSNMFNNCYVLEKLDLGGWDTSSVTDMSSMFWHCYNFESLDLSGWNTSNVTDMSNMFYVCDSLKELDLGGWDTSSVTDMYGMFCECDNLQHIYVGNNWTTLNVGDSRNMFGFSTNGKCTKLPNFDDTKLDKTKAYVGGYLECKSGLTCTCTYSGC